MNKKYIGLLKILPRYVVFLVALSGTLGSLYYSEVESLPPCDLCWYQRILLYPILIIMIVAEFRKDAKVYLYTLPMAIIGAVIAMYNYLIQKTTIFGGGFGCSLDNPCTEIQVNLFGFVTIPLLSFFAFLIIILANWIMMKYGIDYDNKKSN